MLMIRRIFHGTENPYRNSMNPCSPTQRDLRALPRTLKPRKMVTGICTGTAQLELHADIHQNPGHIDHELELVSLRISLGSVCMFHVGLLGLRLM